MKMPRLRKLFNSPGIWMLTALTAIIVRAVLVTWRAASEILASDHATRLAPSVAESFGELWWVAGACAAMATANWFRMLRRLRWQAESARTRQEEAQEQRAEAVTV